MKKLGLIFLFFATSVGTTTIFAQSSKLFLGANAGIGASKISSLLDYGIGYNGNISIQYKLTDHFSLLSGISFDQRNSSDEIHVFDTLDNPYNFLVHHKYNFLQIPILFRAEIGTKTTYFVNIGPHFSYLKNQNMSVLDEDTQLTTENDNTHSFNRTIIGASFGGGVNIPVSDKIDLSCELRTNFDLSNMSKVEGATAKSNSSLVLIGINYCLGK